MDNWEWDRRTILETSLMRYPIGPNTLDRKVAVADIAAIVVTAFEHLDIWTGQIMPLTGDVANMEKITATLSHITGKALCY